jgi:hypothetical protein
MLLPRGQRHPRPGSALISFHQAGNTDEVNSLPRLGASADLRSLRTGGAGLGFAANQGRQVSCAGAHVERAVRAAHGAAAIATGKALAASLATPSW